MNINRNNKENKEFRKIRNTRRKGERKRKQKGRIEDTNGKRSQNEGKWNCERNRNRRKK